jgi:hypothetical protein
VRAGGFGRADLADETFDRTTNSDLQYGYLGYRAPRMNLELRLGRLSVTAGAARTEVLDGFEAGGDLPAGFDVRMWGGVPVVTDADGRADNVLYGARISQGLRGRYRLGVSYLQHEDDNETARQEAAADLFLRPFSAIELTGSSLYNLDADDFARHDYRLALGPFFSRVTLVGVFGWVDYGNYFTFPLNAAFTFPIINPDEILQTIGGELYFDAGKGLRLTLEYTNFDYDILDTATAAGFKADWTRGRWGAGGAYRRVSGENPQLQYGDYRLYCSTSVGRMAIALGLQEVRYETEINGTRDAMTATLAGHWAFREDFALGADVEYGSNPFFDSDVKGMLRLTWRYAATVKGGSGK